jgi:hypothetical protein
LFLLLEAASVLLGALGLLLCLGAFAPFTKELGACESGAVRDVLGGGFILPHYREGGMMVWVPPLSWWTQALAVKWLGWTEIALRLPSLLGAAFTCALLYGWLRATVSRRCALWSAAALLSCRFFVDAARQPRQDALFATLVTAAIVCLERAYRRAGRPQPAWLAASAITVALAALTKGPLGFVLPGIAAVLWLLSEGRWRALFRPALLAALVCTLLLVSLWYTAAYAVGGEDFVQLQVINCLLNRFTGELDMCRHPFYYFFPHVVTGFLPWSLLLPFTAAMLWGARRGLPTPIKLAVFWFVGFIIFFSIPSGKCLAYLVPVFPPLAVITGWAISNLGQYPKPAGWERFFWRLGTFCIGVGVIVLALLAGAVGTWGVPQLLVTRLGPHDREVVTLLNTLTASGGAFFVAWFIASTASGVAATVGALALRTRLGSWGVALAAFAGTIFWFGIISPTFARERTLKPFIRRVESIIPPGATLAYLGEPDCDASFYSRREITLDLDHPPACGLKRPIYLIAPEDLAARLDSHHRACLREITASRAVDTHGRRLLFVVD